MFENMVGPVGFAMHEDRLARGAKNMQRVEAEQGRRAVAKESRRQAIALALSALAARIAPSVVLPGRYTHAAGR